VRRSPLRLACRTSKSTSGPRSGFAWGWIPDTGSLYEDSIIVDNRGGTYGEPLSLILMRPMCPDPASGPSQPVLEIVSDGDVSVRGPIVDMTDGAGCASGPRPGVSFWGGGRFEHLSTILQGWTGYGVANGISGVPGELLVGGAAIVSGQGSAIRSSTSFTVNAMEIAGNRTNGAVALLWLDAADHRLRLNDSVLYGNLADGDETQALVLGSPVVVNNSSFIANAVVGDRPLIATGAVWPDYSEDADNEGAFGGLRNVVLARNRVLQSSPETIPLSPPSSYGDPGEIVCAAVPVEPYETRTHPFDGLERGEELILVEATSQHSEAGDEGENLLFFVGRSFFVENDPGTLIRVEAPGGQADIVLAHNTFGGNNGARMLDLSGEADTSIALIRNLYLDEPRGGGPCSCGRPPPRSSQP
jgi:hypothetical protein